MTRHGGERVRARESRPILPVRSRRASAVPQSSRFCVVGEDPEPAPPRKYRRPLFPANPPATAPRRRRPAGPGAPHRLPPPSLPSGQPSLRSLSIATPAGPPRKRQPLQCPTAPQPIGSGDPCCDQPLTMHKPEGEFPHHRSPPRRRLQGSSAPPTSGSPSTTPMD